MPFLLRAATIAGGFFGIFGTGVGLWVLFRVLVSDGPFQFDGDAVPKRDFLTIALPFLIVYISACLTAGAAAWALWKGKARSRPLLAMLLAEFVLGDAAMLVFMDRTLDVTTGELVSSALVFAVLVALGLWYLFRKQSVVQYYETLRSRPA